MFFSRLRLFPAALLFTASTVLASPVVSVDVDPSTAGIQSVLDVQNGDSFFVDIVISGVESLSPLNAFQFNLGFDPAVLTAVSITDGGFLLEPVFPVAESIDNGAGDVLFALVTLGPIGASGDGILASLVFSASAAGASVLDLNTVLLSEPFGQPIQVERVDDGNVNVAVGGFVSEPHTMAVLTLGLVGLAAFGRRRKTREIRIR